MKRFKQSEKIKRGAGECLDLDNLVKDIALELRRRCSARFKFPYPSNYDGLHHLESVMCGLGFLELIVVQKHSSGKAVEIRRTGYIITEQGKKAYQKLEKEGFYQNLKNSN